jgi:acyl-coenzyme A synthetase/AMP-(fatty) acid ligase
MLEDLQVLDFSNLTQPSSVTAETIPHFPFADIAIYENPTALDVANVLMSRANGFKVVLTSSNPGGVPRDEFEAFLNAQNVTQLKQLNFFTSGTTGRPKLVNVDLDRIFDSTRPDHPCDFWGLAYEPFRMAGLQVIAQAIRGGTRLAIPNANMSPRSKVELFESVGVKGISATPSFFRLAVTGTEKHYSSINYVTLGGEIADQSIIDKVKSAFPAAKVTQIYASSEAGSVFSVSDGLAGFPDTLVNKILRNGKRVRVEDGELIVEILDTPDSQLTQVKTGDLVELRDGRWQFIGRNDQIIKVGAHKVSLIEVENCALSMNGVEEARAVGTPNTFLGSVVHLEVVLQSLDLLPKLESHLRQGLPRSAVPVTIEPVPQLALSSAYKKIRGTNG